MALNIATSENYVLYLRKQGVRVGDNVTIYGRDRIVMDLTRPWMIEIGDNVEITSGAAILTHGYDWCVLHRKCGEILGSAGKVKIGNNVFIGLNTTLLPGTEIGDNVIVGAGSVVKGKLEPDSVYAGVPAKKIMTLEDYAEKRKALQIEEATAMVLEYKKVYGTWPPVEAMHEHFWLFSNKLEGLNPVFLDKLALRGNFEESSARFIAHEPPFSDYQDFLAYCDHKVEK